jgi:lipopolysaccharide biosynthesis protein
MYGQRADLLKKWIRCFLNQMNSVFPNYERRKIMFSTEAVIHSKSKTNSNEPYDVVAIVHEKGSNDVVAEYKGVRYTAILNPFVCRCLLCV